MDQPKILVAIRKRPLSKKEEAKNETDIITVKNSQTVIVSEYKQKVDLTKYIEQTMFNFDFAFNQHTTNQQIYLNAVRPLVDSAFQGAKVTCFAYGQTGSGKTFTMNGSAKMGVTGLYAYGAQDIFGYLTDPKFQHLRATLSFFEIYCGKLFDLLNKRQQLKIMEDKKNNINIVGLEEVPITCWEQFLELQNYGSTQRITSQNSANAESSRSHAILQIAIKEGKKVYGKISFIDLAGNQRGADHTDMKKQTRIDGAEINKSLLSLKQCIRALDQGKGHTPFRGSKLTMVLKDSFIGFCRTVMIGNVSPSSGSSQNTLNTLRYADRVKELKKSPQNISKQELKAREMMLPRQNKNAVRIAINDDDDEEEIQAKKQQAQKNFCVKNKDRENQRFVQKQQLSRQPSSGGGKTNARFIQNGSSKIQRGNQYQPIKPIKAEDCNQSKGNESRNKKSTTFKQKNQRSAQRSNSIKQTISKPPVPSGIKFNMNEYYIGKNFQKTVKNSHLNTQQDILYRNNYTGNFPRPGAPTHNRSITQNLQPNSQTQPLKINQVTNENQGFQGQKILKYQDHRAQHSWIPNDWEKMYDFVQSSITVEKKAIVRQKMHEHLFHEETELMNSHSDSLKTSLEIVHSEMDMLNALERNKDTLSTREYISFIGENIDQKISILEFLRQKMSQFCYKLEMMESIEGIQGNKRQDDEQLLDDLQ